MEKSNDKVSPVKLSYLDSLDSVIKARYLEKLSIIDKTDPYTVEKRKWTQKTKEFPNIGTIRQYVEQVLRLWTVLVFPPPLEFSCAHIYSEVLPTHNSHKIILTTY
jgi:hypothetical protein